MTGVTLEQVEPFASIAVHIDKRFYKKCRRDTWRLLKRMPRADAQDLLHEAFCRLTKLERDLLVRDPAAYLYTITGYVAMEFRRKKRREKQRVVFDSEELERATERAAEADLSPLEDEVNTAQQVQWVQRVLLLLPPTHRAVVVLTQCFGYTQEEAARELSLSPHTVKAYTYQAIRWLRQLVLGPEDPRSAGERAGSEEPDCE